MEQSFNTSVIQNPSYYEKSHCGYCEGTSNGRIPDRNSRIFCFRAQTMPVKVYGQLLDRGFRRSGKFLYKPDVLNSCCPQYTIRLAVDKVKVTKEQRKILRKFNRFACGGEVGEQGREFQLDYEVHLTEEHRALPKEVKQNKSKPRLKYSTCQVNFKVKILPATFTEEKFELYRKYQITIHGDLPGEVTPDGFKNFLCSNPFPKTFKSTTDELTIEQVRKVGGAIHQGYYYNDKLIALAVLDVLPQQCLSSVYFIWDPEYKYLDLGKVGALREIVLARDLGVDYYYLGYYIHSCSKMSYKGEYKPSDLLDPQSCPGKPEWFPLEDFQRELDKESNKTDYVSLLGQSGKQQMAVPETEMKKIVVDSKNPSRYFALQLPGILTMEELVKSGYDIWGAEMLISFYNDKSDDSDDDVSDDDSDNFENSGSKSIVISRTLKEIYEVYQNELIVNMVTELAATLGPSLAETFKIQLR